ncbi:MAG TPA: AMIN domain-containing protein [Gemmatimonadaceae bacterium]|nr:AMIN domain-containing protein [Gemmatimonadaceae bacterium]
MISNRTLATAMLVAFGAIGGRPAALSAARVTPTDATVISLSVVPATGRANVVIRVDGSVTLKHFTLEKPDKIVVDISGATLGLPAGDAYDGIARGGITRIRYSQFTRTVVRIVLTLDATHTYDVSQENGEVKISVDGGTSKFDPWQVTSDAMKADAMPTPVRATPADAPRAEKAPTAAKLPVIERDMEVIKPEEAFKPTAKAAPLAFRTSEITTANDRATANQAQSQEARISWTGEKASIHDVLAMFAAFTDRTILASKNVTGEVTASVNRLPWDVALKEIMNANGYDVTINPDGVIIVDTFESIAARQATIPLATRTVRLNYARSLAVKPMVEVRLSRQCAGPANAAASAAAATVAPVPGAVQSPGCPARGAVTADTITNSISITDIPSQLPELEAYVRSVDLRQPQVNIRAKIVLVDRSTLEGLGLRYDIGSQQQFFNDIIPRTDSTGKVRTDPGQILLGGNTISAIANASARVPSAALQLVYSTAMGNFDFSTFLEALQTNTLLDVQAEPSASVLNNRTANLTAGTQVPIRVIDANSSSGNVTNAPRSLVTMQQTGVILTVTPQITNNRQIQMRVHVENSDVQFQANDVGAVFPTQKVDNEILVADGETAVMGGLTQTSVTMSKSGIPILVDLPLIGRFFGVTNRTETKRDLLILITPHIIDDGQQPETGRP